MAKKVKRIKSDLEIEIELFLKKNRIFTKTTKIEVNDNFVDYIINLLHQLNVDNEINNIIIQFGINEKTTIERFFYTDDNYTIMITEKLLFDEIKKLDYSKYDTLDIYFFDTNGLEYVS